MGNLVALHKHKLGSRVHGLNENWAGRHLRRLERGRAIKMGLPATYVGSPSVGAY